MADNYSSSANSRVTVKTEKNQNQNGLSIEEEEDNFWVSLEAEPGEVICKIERDDEDPGGTEDENGDGNTSKDPLSLDDNCILPSAGTGGVETDKLEGLVFKRVPSKLSKVSAALCTKCHIGFPSPELYKRHLITAHQQDRPFACRHCSKRFAANHQRNKHETIHDPNRFQGPPKFACDLCDKRYHIKVSLETHRKIVHLGYKQPKKNYKKVPVTQHHSVGVRNPNPYKKPEVILPCPHCDLKFNKRWDFNRHLVIHTSKGEKRFQCPTCPTSFAWQNSLHTHIRNVHEQPTTPTGKKHKGPKSQSGQPHPCPVCGKILKNLSQFRRHMTLHTGEKPFECTLCQMKFRRSGDLRLHKLKHEARDTTGMHVFKCRVCGKEGYRRFTEFQNHRIKGHRLMPFEGEKEKPFACGVCGKPHYKRIDAVICAVLGHDPTSLQKAMFKVKCPRCPPERWGYHSYKSVRSHWEREHGGDFLPVELRKGMYQDFKDELPKCAINREKAEELRRNNGVIGGGVVKMEQPLFVELELLPIPEEERLRKRKPSGRRPREKKVHKCEICGLQVVKAGNLKRHMKVHNSGTLEGQGHPSSKIRHVKVEPLMIRKEENLSAEVKTEPVEESVEEEFELEIEKEIPVKSLFNCRFCRRKFLNLRGLRIHELRAHVKPWSTGRKDKGTFNTTSQLVTDTKGHPPQVTVSIYDKAAIKALLGYKVVTVNLVRLSEHVENDN